MNKDVSIVRVDTRPYRKIAQESWGLTDEQMKGKHVHHRVAISEGGTNDPSNLYVCSPSFHRWGWHNGERWIEWAVKGAIKTHEEKDERGKSVNASKGGKIGVKKTNAKRDELGRSVQGVKNAERINSEKDHLGRSVNAVKGANKNHMEKTEDGKSVNAVKMASQRWKSTLDGFISNASGVAKHNRANGWDPNARVRVS